MLWVLSGVEVMTGSVTGTHKDRQGTPQERVRGTRSSTSRREERRIKQGGGSIKVSYLLMYT